MEFSNVLGVSFNVISEAEAVSALVACLDKRKNHIIVTPNPEAVMRARKEADFAEAIGAADFRFADGVGIVLASRLTKAPIKSRVRGYDTAIKLFDTLNRQNRNASVYFLGGAPGVAEAAANKIIKQYPALRAAGWHDGFFADGGETKVVNEIKRLKPDILIIGMGMPKQELFAYRHCGLPVKLTLCLGGSIDIMSGNVKLAPPVMRRLGLEWLHRLIKEPSRAKRMLALPRFALLALWRFVWPLSAKKQR
jgi:N-acetylglucosaminyldiphosphoundecaprenol N-acetyl-beta-D-mannosaminyltransferase